MIRPLVASDLEQIRAIDAAAFPPNEQYGDGMYARMLRSGRSLVAIEGDQIVGYAFIQGSPYTHVRSIAVHPAFRRRGYGRALLQAAIDSGDFEVDLLVLEENKPAIEFYKRLGFTHAEQYPMRPPRRRMVLRLTSENAETTKRRSIWTDARLSCVEFGGKGPPALLIHGLYGRATEWRTTADWLCESHEVFALDQRGNGLSEKDLPDFSRGAQLKDVIASIEDLDRGPVMLVGQSMGGVTAMLVAASRPDLISSLIIVEATSHSNGAGERPEFSAEDMEAASTDIANGYDYRSEWSSIRCPTLLVGGERSPMDQSLMQGMASENPSASYVCIAGGGHDVHLDAPKAFRSVVQTFLSGIG